MNCAKNIKGLTVERFKAISRNDIENSFLKHHLKKLAGQQISTLKYTIMLGIMGCYYSHIECLHLLKDDPNQIGFVFEDDVLINNPDTFVNNVLECVKVLPENWEILRLDIWDMGNFKAIEQKAGLYY